MPYLYRLRDIVVDLAPSALQDLSKRRGVGGCCGQDCGQREVRASLRWARLTACLQRARRLRLAVAELAVFKVSIQGSRLA